MGWLKLGSRGRQPLNQIEGTPAFVKPDLEGSSEHVEYQGAFPKTYPFAAVSVPDSELPYIPPEEVQSHTSTDKGGLFIVVDDVVFNCSTFISNHPGGQQIIQSFAGAECSWQFWRFHGKKEMEEFGKALRVGKTKGMVNKYKEPVRFVGLRRLGDDWG